VRRNELAMEGLTGIVSTVRRTGVFGFREIGFEGRNTVPSNVASIVVTIKHLFKTVHINSTMFLYKYIIFVENIPCNMPHKNKYG
jgi:hypothetical protein